MTKQVELMRQSHEYLATVKHINIKDMSKIMFKFLRGHARRYLKLCDSICSMREWDEHHHDYVKRFNFKKSLADPRSSELIYKLLELKPQSKYFDPYSNILELLNVKL